MGSHTYMFLREVQPLRYSQWHTTHGLHLRGISCCQEPMLQRRVLSIAAMEQICRDPVRGGSNGAKRC